jgi:flagellar hook-associated protein 2
VDGTQSGTIELTQKTYASYAELATEMQSRINGDSAIKAAGVSVGVSYDTGMVLTSQSYGASSQVEITANTTSLGLDGATGIIGLDVAGTLGGQPATGKGQELTSIAGASMGLKLLISDGTMGYSGTVDFSRGIIERLDKVMTGLLGKTGTLTNHSDGLTKGLDDITKKRAQLSERLSSLETRLYTKFNAMDLLIGKMQSTGSFINQQFFKTTKNN